MKVSNLVPRVYYEESRDFSYIGRLFEVVFNYMKTGTDLVNVNLDDKYINSNIIDLCALTLGFESKHKYITKDLIGIISIFTELIKNKGTLKAIRTIIKLLCTSQNISTKFYVQIAIDDQGNKKPNELKIILPQGLKDIILMEDLFDYILPAGTLYTLSYGEISQDKYSTEVITKDSVAIKEYADDKLNVINSGNLNEIEYTYILLEQEEKPYDWDINCTNYFIQTSEGRNFIYSRVPAGTEWKASTYYQAKQKVESGKRVLQDQWSTIYTGITTVNKTASKTKTKSIRKKKES